MSTSSRSSRPFALGSALLTLLVVLLAVSASVALADSPVTWQPAASSYGPLASPTPFATGFPIPDGYGGASGGTLPTTAVAGGVWDAASGVFTVGFAIPPITTGGLPSMAQTELSATPLKADTRLSMVFTKAAGQRVDSIAMLADPDAPVTLDYAPAASLTDATRFTVVASVAEPVASAGGKVTAAFGMIVDCSPLDARDAYGSIFVTNMSWLDVAPPAFTSSGVAGLSANGANGVKATFDGILSPGLLAHWGVLSASAVHGYVDSGLAAGLTGATFSGGGLGNGSDWPLDWRKYRVTNSVWSKHDILWGVAAPPLAKAAGTSPKGSVRGAKPTFKWRVVSGARSYEVNVFKGGRQVLKKAGVTGLSWKARKALPRGVYLTWKVKAVNASGAGPWSTALRFKIK